MSATFSLWIIALHFPENVAQLLVRITGHFLCTAFSVFKIYFIPQDDFVLNNSWMAGVVLMWKHFFCSFISKKIYDNGI